MRRTLTRARATLGWCALALTIVASSVAVFFVFAQNGGDGPRPAALRESPPIAITPPAEDRMHAPPLVPFPYKLAPGVFILGGLEPSAAYVIETRQGLVLVDAGLQPDASLVKAQMALLGLDPGRLRAILITHAHGDHSGRCRTTQGRDRRHGLRRSRRRGRTAIRRPSRGDLQRLLVARRPAPRHHDRC